jgi:hypothetical protein
MVGEPHDRLRERAPQFRHALERDDLGRRGVEVRAFEQRVVDPGLIEDRHEARIVSIVCMPVDRMTGFPFRAMWRMSGRLSASPEPIL